MGDFNSTPDSKRVQNLAYSTNLLPIKTKQGTRKGKVLDFFMQRDVLVLNSQVGQLVGQSDHRHITVEVRLELHLKKRLNYGFPRKFLDSQLQQSVDLTLHSIETGY